MICPLQTEQTDLLLDYSAGRLDASKAANLEQHMEICRNCASFRMEQAAVWDALDLWEPAPVNTDFNRRLWQKIDAAAAAPWYRDLAATLRLSSWKPLIPLTAAILVIAAGFLFDHPGAKSPAPGVGVSVSLHEADQVEQTLDDIQLLRQLDPVSLPTSGNSKTM